MLVVGTAGWSIPRDVAGAFPGDGPHLARYSRVCTGAEINSSFHRPHAHKVYAKWAALTPADFRFAVKLPRAITHEGRLRRARVPLEQFLSEIGGLGAKLGPLLIQLPPSHAFDLRVARTFLAVLRERHHGAVVCEPRHPSWLTPPADAVLQTFEIGRVAADPSAMPEAMAPGGWLGPGGGGGGRKPVAYYRLHGSPRIYWSRYPVERIAAWGQALASLPTGVDGWCMFDNTASGSAAANALELLAHLREGRLSP